MVHVLGKCSKAEPEVPETDAQLRKGPELPFANLSHMAPAFHMG